MAEVNSRLFHIETGILPTNAFVVVVRTDWNAEIVDELEEGCKQVLSENGVLSKTVIVPGAVEIPFAIKTFWEVSKQRPHSFVALGCVIRGDTPHFDYVCRSVTDGVLQLNLNLPVPTIFGVLTVDDIDQARERIGGRHGHKGREAAISAIKMMQWQQFIKSEAAGE